MTLSTNTATTPPRAILMATNLGPSSDRALERAALQAREWNARLIVVHVVDDSLSSVIEADEDASDPQQLALRELEALLPSDLMDASVRIESGDTAEAILRVARQEGCDLIVTGVAEDDFLMQMTLGRPLDRLLRHAEAPILVVRDLPRMPYVNIVVALELTDAARPAFETAAQYFPGQPLTALHAADAPMAGLADDISTYRETFREGAEAEARSFLADNLPDDVQDRVRLHVRSGAPCPTLSAYAQSHGVDLVVAGAHGRGALHETFFGSVSKDLADGLPCDTLLVRV